MGCWWFGGQEVTLPLLPVTREVRMVDATQTAAFVRYKLPTSQTMPLTP